MPVRTRTTLLVDLVLTVVLLPRCCCCVRTATGLLLILLVLVSEYDVACGNYHLSWGLPIILEYELVPEMVRALNDTDTS